MLLIRQISSLKFDPILKLMSFTIKMRINSSISGPMCLSVKFLCKSRPKKRSLEFLFILFAATQKASQLHPWAEKGQHYRTTIKTVK